MKKKHYAIQLLYPDNDNLSTTFPNNQIVLGYGPDPTGVTGGLGLYNCCRCQNAKTFEQFNLVLEILELGTEF